MSGNNYFCLAISAPAGLAERLTELLAALGYASLEERASAAGVTLIVYAEQLPALERARASIEQALAAVGVSNVSYALAPVDPSWALAWTAHLDPVQLTPTLRVLPSGAPAGDRSPNELYLEPAFAFGFGEHASTRLVASWLEQECRAGRGASVLDVGTGTGILALVAARSGAARVLGIDTSHEAVLAARHNAAQNGLGERCRFEPTSLLELGGAFDLVVANIESAVLLELAPLLAARLGAHGVLALAGFIDEQVPRLCVRFAALGVVLRSAGNDGEWHLLTGSTRAP
jgi:ribosomal protein L11 methyltransferase